MCKLLGHYVKFRSVLLRSDYTMKRMKNNLNTKLDVLVTTPGIFTTMYSKGYVRFSDVRYVVADEADTLFSENQGFKEDLVEKILKPCLNLRNNHPVQFVFVLATVNKWVKQFIEKEFPVR